MDTFRAAEDRDRALLVATAPAPSAGVGPASDPAFKTLKMRKEGAVSADPDFFISHVDVNRLQQYRDEAAKLVGEASIALLFRYLSASRFISIAQIEGRVCAAGSEFVLACDMRFAARESAIFAQPEAALGVVPSGGGVQHLTRLMDRGRALEVMLSAENYTAKLANGTAGSIERCPQTNSTNLSDRSLIGLQSFRPAVLRRSKPASTRSRSRRPRSFVATQIFLARARALLKVRTDSRLRSSVGFQTREAEMDLAQLVGDLN
jgi:enoyl-CoA hydratase/carnithine racemase